MPNGTHATQVDATSDPPPEPQPKQIDDASAKQPCLNLDAAPAADLAWVCRFRDSVHIGRGMRRLIKARRIDAGDLKSFLTAFATYVTNATGNYGRVSRRPKHLAGDLNYTRTRFFELLKAASTLGYLASRASGTRGVVRYELTISGPPIKATTGEESGTPGRFRHQEADEASGTPGRFATKRPARPDASGTKKPTKSPARPDASQTPTITDLSDQHQLDELATKKQVGKLCVLDRGAGFPPRENHYRHLTRTAAWDLIAERERDKTTTACALNEDVSCGRCHKCRPDQQRCAEWKPDGRRRCVLLAKHDGPHQGG